MSNNEYVELDLEVLHMTREALYLTDGDMADWIPISNIKDGVELGFDIIGITQTFEIKEWAAQQAGFI